MNRMPERLTVQVEVARGDRVKRRPDGSMDFVTPFASPFAYGSVVGTTAPDGDPEDALVVGAEPQRGDCVEYTVWGRVLFVDAGLSRTQVGGRAARAHPAGLGAHRRLLHPVRLGEATSVCASSFPQGGEV